MVYSNDGIQELILMINQWQAGQRQDAVQGNKPVIIEIHPIHFPMHWQSTCKTWKKQFDFILPVKAEMHLLTW